MASKHQKLVECFDECMYKYYWHQHFEQNPNLASTNPRREEGTDNGKGLTSVTLGA